MVSFASRLVGYFCSYYIYIIPIPPLYNVLCNARNCFTISLWSPWRQGLQQEFSSRSEEKFENKRASKFWRQGAIRGNEILLQAATNKLQLFSPKSVKQKATDAAINRILAHSEFNFIIILNKVLTSKCTISKVISYELKATKVSWVESGKVHLRFYKCGYLNHIVTNLEKRRWQQQILFDDCTKNLIHEMQLFKLKCSSFQNWFNSNVCISKVKIENIISRLKIIWYDLSSIQPTFPNVHIYKFKYLNPNSA